MPEKRTMTRARRDLKSGKSVSTAAGEFVREEIEHVRKGKHGARSSKQLIAIGLSKARRAGVPLKPPKAGGLGARSRRAATRDYDLGQSGAKASIPSRRRSIASERALEREPRVAASRAALASHAREAAVRRGHSRHI